MNHTESSMADGDERRPSADASAIPQHPPGSPPPSGVPPGGSEVQRLLTAIRLEYEAAHRGLESYAIVSRHRFITTKLESMGQLHEKLEAIVGEEAIALVAEALQNAPEGCHAP